MAKGEVDLIIRAKNDATKALDAISQSLKNLSDQQIIVGKSADKADGQLNSLSLELTKLRTNAQNLQQLANVATVVDKATAALERQKEALQQATAEQSRLSTQSEKMKSQQQDLSTRLRSATTDLKTQTEAASQARTALSTLGKEATALSTSQRNAQRSLEAVTKLITTQETALATAQQKYASLAAAVDASDKPTKRLTTSLEAAERAMQKRQASLDASRQKELALRETLTQSAQAQQTNAAAITQATSKLDAEKAALDAAKNSVAKLTAESSSLAKSQQSLNGDMSKAAAVTATLKTGLDSAESEYAQVVAAAEQARAKVGQSSASMTDMGQAAVQAANELATFSARMRVLQSGSGTSSSKTALLDPAAITQALAALKNAQAVVQATEREYSKAAVSADMLATAMTSAGTAGDTLSKVSDAVTRQKTAVDGAYTSWKQAEDEVKRLAIAIQGAAEPSEALAAAFGQAQGQARLAKNEFLNQKNVGDQLATTLEKAGAGAGTLSSAESALAGAARTAADVVSKASTATAAMANSQESAVQSGTRLSSLFNSLTTTGNKLAAVAGQAAAGIAKIRSGASSAAGPVGGLAGELKGLAAQVAGLYAIKEGIEGVVSTSNKFDALNAQIGVAFAGDVNKSTEALNYALTVAKNLKLPLLDTAKGYAQMAAAARGTALEGEGVNKIFTAFAQAARVTRTSSADLNGIFIALTQSISKGKVQAEELRGQLGDRFPGAVQIMAQALGVSNQQLEQMLQKGQLTTDTLVRMSAEVSKRVAPELEKALDSPQAKLQAFQNSWTELQLKLAKSGFLDSIANAAERLGDALSKPETVQMVNQLGIGLADVVNYISQVEDPLGKVQIIVEALVGVKLVTWLVDVVSGLVSMSAGMYTLATAAAAADIAIAPILVGVGALAALVAAPWLAQWAYDNFPAFREGVWSIGTVTQTVGSSMQLAIETALIGIKTIFMSTINEINSLWAGLLSYVAGSAAKTLNFFNSDALDGWANRMESEHQQAAKGATDAWTDGAKQIDAAQERYAQRQKDRDAEIAAQRKKFADDQKKEQATLANSISTASGGAVGTGVVQPPSGKFKPDTSDSDAKAAAAAAKKRAALEKSVADQISAIRSRLDTNTANDLDTQIAGVEEKYKGLYADLTKLGKGQGSEEWQTVDALKAQEIQLVKNRAAKAASAAQDKKGREGEAQVNTLLSLRRDMLQQIKYAEDHGDNQTADKLKVQYDLVNQQLVKAIDNQIKFWEAVGGSAATLAIAKLKAVKDGLANINDTGILTANNINKQLLTDTTSSVDGFLDSIAQGENVFSALGDSVRKFASTFLLNIAKMIAQQAVFNALAAASSAGGSSGFGGLLSKGIGAVTSYFGTSSGSAAGISAVAGTASVAHTGGLAGSPLMNSRSVDTSIFSNATRYHTGGVVGLQPWEVPIVAKRNEEVLTEDDPRHISNMGSASGSSGSAASPDKTTIINAVDSDSVVQAGLSTAAGQKKIINIIRANKQTLKTILG